MIKELVIRYANEIEYLSNRIRREINNSESEYEAFELNAIIENCFFESNLAQMAEPLELSYLIKAISDRVIYKYGILTEYLNDPDVNEIMVNGPAKIFVEKYRRLIEVDNAFTSAKELEETIRMLASDVHREINEAQPVVDARLQNGYRVNGVLSNVALNGPILTIRKFSEKEITLEDLVAFGSISQECCDEIATYVNCGYNIFISGGTSSGKTSFLNALAGAIDPRERVIIIEDSAELRINGLNNKVQMECRNANSAGMGEVTMQSLIKTSLRMRPDRIIVGEVRGREVVDMIQAMNTGHEGSMSTGHGNSIKGMLNRLEAMYLMDTQIPMYSIRNQIANAIDIFVHLRRDSNGKRGVVEVAELLGFDGEKYQLNYLYRTNEKDELVSTGNSLQNRTKLHNLSLKDEVIAYSRTNIGCNQRENITDDKSA